MVTTQEEVVQGVVAVVLVVTVVVLARLSVKSVTKVDMMHLSVTTGTPSLLQCRFHRNVLPSIHFWRMLVLFMLLRLVILRLDQLHHDHLYLKPLWLVLIPTSATNGGIQTQVHHIMLHLILLTCLMLNL